jgi:DNA-binding LytR/AlgR family response regulator
LLRSSARTESSRADQDNALTVPTRAGPITITLHEIEAILAAENYVRICTVGGKEYLHRATLSSMQDMFGAERLVRLHRSALVNTEHIQDRRPNWHICLPSGRIIRVGRSFRGAIGRSPKAK